MNQSIVRSVFRWIHIVFGIPILGYIYSPFDKIPQYVPATRFVFVPIILLSGLWMWKGHVLRRLISKRPARPDDAASLLTEPAIGMGFRAQERAKNTYDVTEGMQ